MGFKEVNDRYRDVLEEVKAVNKMEFSDKETYLLWRSVWRVLYKEVSSIIRDYKGRRSPYEEPADYWVYQSFREVYRNVAFDLMDTRMRAKERSKLLKQHSQ